MRYVQLDEFMKLPAGTVYMEPDIENGQPTYGLSWPIKFKGANVGDNDWNEFDLVEAQLEDGEDEWHSAYLRLFDEGKSVPVDPDTVGCRFGEYPKQGDVAFIVLDEADVRAVIGLLELALTWQKDDE